MMAVVNGDLPFAPPDLRSLSPGKRKRDLTPEGKDLNRGNGNDKRQGDGAGEGDFGEILKDLLQVMSTYDSGLGLLQRPLPARSSSEPDGKRPKLSDAADETKTIESRILSREYQSLQSLVEDIQTAEKSMFQELGQSAGNSNGRPTSPAVLAERTGAFKGHLNNLIRRHPFKLIPLTKRTSQEQATRPEENLPPSVPRDDKIILTVLGNAPRGRQLFSSLQKLDDRNTHSSISPAPTIDESALPHGVSTSRVIPFNPVSLEETKKTRTIGEVFAPRASLPALEPPRKREPPGSGSSVVSWLSPVDAATARYSTLDRRYYSSSTVPAAQWLNYGFELPTKQPRLRKYQPGVDFDSSPHDNSPSQALPKRDSMSFNGLYSSFAPTFDSFGSVVPPTTKGHVWWGKLGLKRLGTIALSQDEMEVDATSETPQMPLDESSLQECVNSFVPDVIDPQLVGGDNKDNTLEERSKDAEEILQEISDLLRTLDSYRQLRNLGSNPSSAAEPSAITNTGIEPSDAEMETYKTLKSSLAAMIATLPPYAVAKLDGAQLADLNISRKILVDNLDYAGTMEEDEYSLQQRQAQKVAQAMLPAARTPTANVSRTPTAPQYQRYAARAKQQSSNYQTPLAYTNRPPVSGHHQPNGSPQVPNTMQPAAQRAPYVPQPRIPQPYTHTAMLQQFQKSTPNGNSPSISQRGPSPAQPLQQPYQPRVNYPQQAVPNNAYGSPTVGPRSASPQKPGPSSLGQSPQRQYMSPVQNQNPPRYYDQKMPNPQAQQHVSSTPGPYQNVPSNQGSPSIPPYSNANMAYARTAAEQAALMERNKAQLMEAQRQGSRTPQA